MSASEGRVVEAVAAEVAPIHEWVHDGEVPCGDMPSCKKCYGLMIATGKARTVDSKKGSGE